MFDKKLTHFDDPDLDFELTQNAMFAWFVVLAGLPALGYFAPLGLLLIGCGFFMACVARPKLIVDKSGITLVKFNKQLFYPWSNIKDISILTTTVYFVIPVAHTVHIEFFDGKAAGMGFFGRSLGGNKIQLPNLPIKAHDLARALDIRREFARYRGGQSPQITDGFSQDIAKPSFRPALQARTKPSPANWSDSLVERQAAQVRAQEKSAPSFAHSGFSASGLAPTGGGFGKRQSPLPKSNKKQWPDY